MFSLPLLRKEGPGVVDNPRREFIWSLRLKLFLKLYLELFRTNFKLNFKFNFEGEARPKDRIELQSPQIDLCQIFEDFCLNLRVFVSFNKSLTFDHLRASSYGTHLIAILCSIIFRSGHE